MVLRWALIAGLLVTLAGVGTQAFAQDLQGEARKGVALTRAQAAALEHQLVENPQNLAARAQLLGYYHEQRVSGPRERHRQHLLWFIRNIPESGVFDSAAAKISPMWDPDGYIEAKEAWLRLTREEPKSVVLLRNAAGFVGRTDNQLSVRLLGRAEALEPSNPQWAAELGRSRWREAHSTYEGTDTVAAARALADFERAYGLSDAEDAADLMPDLAVTAFAAGALGKARGYAEAMLAAIASDRNEGAYIHYGNLVLGRLALADGNLEEAGARLLAAGRTRGAPLGRPQGPDMALAKALLEHGQAQTVLQYLELCLGSWESRRDRLKDWMVLIEAGLIPDFDHNFLF